MSVPRKLKGGWTTSSPPSNPKGRDFLARFNRVRMTSPNITKGIVVPAFQNGLSREGSRGTIKLLSRLMKYPPATWDDIHNAYCAEVRVDNKDLNGPTRRLISVQSEPWKECRDHTRRDHPLSRLGREPVPSKPRSSTYMNDWGMPLLLCAHNFVCHLQRWSPPLRSSERRWSDH